MKDLSISEMKKIVYEVINSEEENNKIKINLYPVVYSEYYTKYVFNKKISLLKKLRLIKLPIIAGGFNDLNGDIVIFLDKVNKIVKVEGKILKLLIICYHESRHNIQQKSDI